MTTEQKVFQGNNLELLKNYPDNYFDAIVTDPPYGLGKEPDAHEMLQAWITDGYLEVKGAGFMGKEWDAFVPQPIFWKEVFRVLKHGGHVLAFYGTRTYDWGVMAMRLAGFEVRDCIQWVYGSGFPKSHNVSKAIDAMYGAEREVVGKQNYTMPKADNTMGENSYGISGGKLANGTTAERIVGDITAPATEKAKEWEGWGSAIKPAVEPIVLARKPLEKGLSIAENVLKWGTGAINIDGCRIGFKNEADYKESTQKNQHADFGTKPLTNNIIYGDYSMVQPKNYQPEGRFPANIILSHHPDCECKGLKKIGTGKEGGYNYEGNVYEVEGFVTNNSPKANSNYGQETVEHWECHEDCPIKIMDEQSGESKSCGGSGENSMGALGKNGKYGKYALNIKGSNIGGLGDTGGASRFFYIAKASKSERNRGLNGFETKQTKGGGGGIGDYLEDVNSASGKYGSEKAPSRNHHPTIKPVKLMQYLVRLITPPNGLVLDPFCGSGTTGIACKLENFNFVGMELDAEYAKIAEARVANYTEEPETELEFIEEEQQPQRQLNLF
jgi:DNA modification methylase